MSGKSKSKSTRDLSRSRNPRLNARSVESTLKERKQTNLNNQSLNNLSNKYMSHLKSLNEGRGPNKDFVEKHMKKFNMNTLSKIINIVKKKKKRRK